MNQARLLLIIKQIKKEEKKNKVFKVKLKKWILILFYFNFLDKIRKN